jgi:hypothetical protein
VIDSELMSRFGAEMWGLPEPAKSQGLMAAMAKDGDGHLSACDDTPWGLVTEESVFSPAGDSRRMR